MNNEKEIENWNGPVGERWVTFQESLDARLHAYGERMLAAASLAPGLRVLDVGAGCGDMTLEAARAVGASGSVVGVDVSRPMLGRARERAKALSNVELVEHDASTFSADRPFDAVISRFGVMFFGDPAGAFANVHALTKRGGALTFVCWQALSDNPWASEPLAAVTKVLPEPPAPAAPDAPGPFSFADPERVRAILTGAGWKDVALAPFVHDMVLGKDLEDALQYATRMGPAARLLHAADDTTRAAAGAAIRKVVERLAPTFTLRSAVWVVTAKA